MVSKKPKHILTIRLSAMGDVAMAIPVLRALTQQHPEVKVTVLTRDFFKPFFRDIPNVSVFTADVKGKHKGVFGLYKLAKQLNKAYKFYAVADLHNVLRSKLLKLFVKYQQLATIDKGRSEKNALISGQNFKQLKTTHERYADVFKSLGFTLDLSSPIFPDSKVLNKKLEHYFSGKTKKHIGIAPFAAHKGKMYPIDVMEKLIKELSKSYTVILFGGGKEEIDILNQFEKFFNNVNSVAGKLTLEEELDVISNLDVMVSMDSGNAHIAAMLGIKVVTIWGVTHPYAGFAPFNQPEDYALLADRSKYPLIPTSVYGKTYPEGYENCAGSISPQTIIDKIECILES